MKKWLIHKLICPDCRKNETPLDIKIISERKDDVIEGDLKCSSCKNVYPIHKGIAVILPRTSASDIYGTTGYNSTSMLSSYLWSHFCDILEDPDATEAYCTWSSFFMKSNGGLALDIGCSVGRLSLELSKTHSQIIGVLSVSMCEKKN